jgi:hypothetical protein
MAVLLALGFFLFSAAFLVPAHDGVDQNAYVVAGKLLGQDRLRHSPRIEGINPDTGQPDPFQFVGRMWVGVDLGTGAERYYPKYPVGLPVIDALAYPAHFELPRWLGGGTVGGGDGVYWVSPLCMSLTVLATFFLIRPWAGSFSAMIGMVLLACSPVVLSLANNPNSHATALLVVTLGMVMLLRWLRRGGTLAACAAGLLLGIAVTVRYAELAMVLPVGLVILLRVFGREDQGSKRRRVFESLVLLAWWSLPVLGLMIFNVRALGTLTGYEPTNESSWDAFDFHHFLANWETLLRQLHDTGLVFVLPFAVFGLTLLFRRDWRLAAVLAAWALLPFVLHAFYYWNPEQDAARVGYLRLMLSGFPALGFAAAWGLSRTSERMGEWGSGGVGGAEAAAARSPAALAATFAVVALAVLLGTRAAVQLVEPDQRRRLSLYNDAAQLQAALGRDAKSSGAIVFASEPGLLNHVQFATPHRYYDARLFDARYVKKLISDIDLSKPSDLDPHRRQALADYLAGRLDRQLGYSPSVLSPQRWMEEAQWQLEQERRMIIAAAMKKGRRVVLLQQNTRTELPRGLDADSFETRVLATWRTYAPTDGARGAQPTWQLIEVLGRSAVPATAPATRLSDSP